MMMRALLAALLVLSASCGKKSSSSGTGGLEAPGTEGLQPRPVPGGADKEADANADENSNPKPESEPKPVLDRKAVTDATDAFMALVAKRKAMLDERHKELLAGRTAELPGAVELEKQLAEKRAELGQYLGTDADKILKTAFKAHNLVIDMDRDLDKAAADLERLKSGPVKEK